MSTTQPLLEHNVTRRCTVDLVPWSLIRYILFDVSSSLAPLRQPVFIATSVHKILGKLLPHIGRVNPPMTVFVVINEHFIVWLKLS